MLTNNQCITCRFGGHKEKSCMAQPCMPKYIQEDGCPLYAMSAQAFMQRVPDMQRRIVEYEERAAHYRDMATRITGTLGGVRVKGGLPQSRMEKGMDAFMDICRDIESEAKKLYEHMRAANAILSKLPDEKEREILELRYMSGYEFDDIALRMSITERTVRRIHVRALEHVQREMDLMEYAKHRPGWNPETSSLRKSEAKQKKPSPVRGGCLERAGEVFA